LEEYKKVVGDEKTKIVAVRFFAPWCKACKAVAPLFHRLTSEYPNVMFVDVPVTEQNANLHQGLGVPCLPFGHIYHPTSGLVEELKLSRKVFSTYAKVLKTYVEGECLVEDVLDRSSRHVDGEEEEEEMTVVTSSRKECDSHH
jgi:thiol-disulfide isomerase/thioredoxin